MDRVTGLGGLFFKAEDSTYHLPSAQRLSGSHHIRDRQDKVRFLVAGWDAGVSVFNVNIPSPQAHTQITQHSGFVWQGYAQHFFLCYAHA